MVKAHLGPYEGKTEGAGGTRATQGIGIQRWIHTHKGHQ